MKQPAVWTGVLSIALLVSGAMAQPEPATRPARPDGPRHQRHDRPARPMMDPQRMLDRMKNAVGELDLSAEQKTKIDELFQKAATDLKALRDDANNNPPAGRRGGAFREYMRQLHQDLNQILNDEQIQTLREKMGPPRDGQRGPATRPFGQRLRDALGKLDLTDEQKTQVDQLLNETAEKMRALHEQAREQNEQVREQFRQVMTEAHEKLNNLLTPEQRDKLRELMPRRGPEGRGGPGEPNGERHPRGPRPDGPPQDKPRGEQI